MSSHENSNAIAGQLQDVPVSVMRQVEHELRTPLHGILGMLGLLLDGNLPPASMIQAEAAKASAESLMSVLNDLVDYTSIVEHRLHLDVRPFHPVEMIEHVAELHAAEAARKGLEIAWYVDPAIPHSVLGDPDRARQIFHALCNNAVRYTETGAISLSLSLQGMEDGRLYLQGTVGDTGTGIPQVYHSRVGCLPIVHDGGYGRTSSGTGLGLYLARNLVEQMGGSFHWSSSDAEGTLISFTLQLEAVIEETPVHAYPSYDVLLIEPSALIRHTMAKQLRSDGHRVTDVESIYDAVGHLNDDEHLDVVCLADGGQGGSVIALNSLSLLSSRHVPVIRMVPFGVHAHDPVIASDRPTVVVHKPVRRMALRKALSQVCGEDPADKFEVSRATAETVATYSHDLGSQGPSWTERDQPSDPQKRQIIHGDMILVVDDSPTNLLLASSMLRKAGYCVETAESGREAIDRLMNEQKFGLILMDISMPVMDGITATRLIRDMGGSMTGLPIIAYSANIQNEDKRECRDAGMTDFLPKPARRGMMLAKVEEYLSRQSTAESPVFDSFTASQWRESAGDEMFLVMIKRLHQRLHELFDVPQDTRGDDDNKRRIDLAVSCDQAGLLRLAEILRTGEPFNCRQDPSLAALLDESMTHLECLRAELTSPSNILEMTRELH